MLRTTLAIFTGILLGIIIVSAILHFDPQLAKLIALQTKNVYFDSSVILVFLTVVLFRITLKEREQIASISTQKNQSEHHLYEQRHLFETIFAHTTTGIALLNLDGQIKRANKALAELLGYTEEALVTLNYYYLIPQHDLINLHAQIQDLVDRKLEIYHSEHECYRKNGESLWIKSTLALMRAKDDKPLYLILQVQNISLQKKAEERLRHMAYHDPLTGLANRHKLEQTINQIINDARRHQQNFALIFLDLDRFKTINDTIGHDAGDFLLQVVGERLRKSVRNTDIVARLGGDEFVLLVTNVKKTENIAIIAEKILQNILQVILIKGKEIYITTSIGISLYPFDGQTMQVLMKNADLAMYRAKDHGRNNYQFYTQEMTAKAQEKLALQTALGHALMKNEFLLHYQPKMSLQDRKVTGVEALLRWKSKEYSTIAPNEIIALAEETGLIIPVSDWIFVSACKQLKHWHDVGLTDLTVAVNCSARQFKQASFIDNILKTVNNIGISPHQLEIEVTESAIMQDPENALRILYALKDIGIRIAIDDFGTGYWSLNNLRRLAVDKIKIDKTFIRQIPEDESTAAIVSAIIGMINRIGIISVAEGVETREQYSFLLHEGCKEIQGYYISQPLPADQMTTFLRNPIPIGEFALES